MEIVRDGSQVTIRASLSHQVFLIKGFFGNGFWGKWVYEAPTAGVDGVQMERNLVELTVGAWKSGACTCVVVGYTGLGGLQGNGIYGF